MLERSSFFNDEGKKFVSLSLSLFLTKNEKFFFHTEYFLHSEESFASLYPLSQSAILHLATYLTI